MEWDSWEGGYTIDRGLVCMVYPFPPTSNTQIILPVSGSGCIWSVARLQGIFAKRTLSDLVSMSPQLPSVPLLWRRLYIITVPMRVMCMLHF